MGLVLYFVIILLVVISIGIIVNYKENKKNENHYPKQAEEINGFSNQTEESVDNNTISL